MENYHTINTDVDYTGGLMPPEFLEFVRVCAIMGFIAAEALVSALVYKGIGKLYGYDRAKKYKWKIVIADVIIFFIFLYIYFLFF